MANDIAAELYPLQVSKYDEKNFPINYFEASNSFV